MVRACSAILRVLVFVWSGPSSPVSSSLVSLSLSLFLCLLSLSLSLSTCDVVCFVAVLCCVCRCGRGVCVWVWCGTLKTPCERSKRTRVYPHHAHMCFNMWAWCPYTRGRFESTHGNVLDGRTERGNHRQFCFPKFDHIRLSQHVSRFLQSFALPDKAVQFQSS